MTNLQYVHGHSNRENIRLFDQANTLSELLHHDTRYSPGTRVLEAGCGVGAQTIILARNNPEARFTSIDISQDSLDKANSLIESEGIINVAFQIGDIFDLPFDENEFDHIFVCFVLEHLKQPLEALTSLRSFIKPGGSITVIEGDHGSAYYHPESDDAQRTIQCLIDIQAQIGGNSLIGRQVYPLMVSAGYRGVKVSPRVVYVDGSRPEWIEGFTRNTFNAMVEGVKEQALELGLIDLETWEKGIADLYATANEEGVFCYTFFKGVAIRE
jgi:ubiquinone/menaquinone biosynthesis C-methylase UbiE